MPAQPWKFPRVLDGRRGSRLLPHLLFEGRKASTDCNTSVSEHLSSVEKCPRVKKKEGLEKGKKAE